VVGREVKRLAALGCSLQSSQRRGRRERERGWQAAAAALETLSLSSRLQHDTDGNLDQNKIQQ